MRIAGWTITILLIVVSIAVSIILFQMGIFFFFLPIIFIPFIGMWGKRQTIPRCPKCGLKISANYCPNCGKKMRRQR
jgi:hypothetical protein